MERLWAPWRAQYVASFTRADQMSECFLCVAAKSAREHDRELLVVARWESCFALLNRYPYNSGHVMVAPYRHVGEMEELADAELCELMVRVREVLRALKSELSPHGFNVGLNLGRAAGAGLPEHLHIHIVPRWHGDTNFMPVLAEVKVVSQALEEVYERLHAALHGGS
jgi:ATP adenylyltransferase